MLYLADDKSVTESIRVIQEFLKAAGPQINKYKSMYKYLGRWAGRREAICEYQLYWVFPLGIQRGMLSLIGERF